MDADTEFRKILLPEISPFFLLHLTYFRLPPEVLMVNFHLPPPPCFGGHAATAGAHCELVARLEFGPSVLDEIVLQESVIALWKGWQ